MDPGWDHTENEDKLLLAHTLGMCKVTNDDLSNNSVSMIGCSNNNTSTNYEIISLSAEYINFLSSIVINNANYIPISNSSFLFFFNKIFSIVFYSYFVNPVDTIYSNIVYIYRQFQSCNSSCTCECTIKCESPCNGNTICLCICSCTSSPSGSSNGCCVCICKHKDGCKCVCICICNKPGESCCCNTGTHNCEKSIFKVDINSLLIQTWNISGHLNWIRCCISRIEKKCCSCSCCLITCCGNLCCTECQSIINCYKSIMSRINSVEFLFKEVGKKILDLTKLYKTPPLKYIIEKKCKPCESCGCNDKLKELTQKIQKVVDYYSSFASIIGDIRMLVDYKTFCPQANEIIENLNKSVSPLLNQLDEINSQELINVDYSGKLNNMIVVVFSHYCIFQCFLAMYILLQSSSKISTTIYNIIWSDMCQCHESNSGNNNCLKISDYEKYLIPWCNTSIENLKKLTVKNDLNHTCLCLVIKYVLYPNLIKLFYYLRHVYLDTLGKKTREFTSNIFNGIQIDEATKLIYLIILLLDKITLWMKTKYYYGWLVYTNGVYIQCFCKNYEDPWYPYLISIILYVSSLMENIWSMDIESMRLSIECLSSLLAEYQSIHVYTNYYSPSRYSILRSMISGLINGKLIESTASHSAVGLIDKSKSSLMFKSRLSGKTTLTQSDGTKSTTSLFSTLSTESGGFFNKSLKSAFMSVRSMFIGTLFSKDKFTLLYRKFSGMWFYTENSNIITKGRMRSMTNLGKKISLEYLDKICKEQCEKKCFKVGDGLWKICPIGKIRMRCLGISFKDMGLIIGNVSGDMLLNDLIQSVDRSRDFITNLCVGFGEVYTIMLKNLLIWTRYPMNINNIENIGVTNVETRNWGYDTYYEHFININSYGFMSII